MMMLATAISILGLLQADFEFRVLGFGCSVWRPEEPTALSPHYPRGIVVFCLLKLLALDCEFS